MNQLAKNKFLMGMGIVFVVAIAVFAILVYPTWGATDAKTKKVSATVGKIKGELASFPGEPNMTVWKTQADELKARYGRSLEELMKLDRNLSDWFPDVDDDSTYDHFMNRYEDEGKKLQSELQEKGVLLGSPQTGDDNKLTETGLP